VVSSYTGGAIEGPKSNGFGVTIVLNINEAGAAMVLQSNGSRITLVLQSNGSGATREVQVYKVTDW
jgi:hypothetical protein